VGLSLTVLGCAGSYPGDGLPCSGYLVRSATTAVVLDLGHGTLPALRRHVDLADLDAVVVSHAHPDHWVDLTAMRILTHYHLHIDGIPVWATEGTVAMLEAVCTDVNPAFDTRVLGPEPVFTIGDLTFAIDRTDHYVETYAVRVSDPEGRSLVYSADTGPGWSMDAIGRDVDLALLESSFATEEERGDVLHLSAGVAGAMARAAGARRLVLTHLVPGSDPEEHARLGADAYGGPVDLAAPGAVYEL
jgi:ribonuclease BN (tRNA processing enzyme)